MIYVLALLLSYAICFGAINKVGVHFPIRQLRLLDRSVWIKGFIAAFFDTLFTCPYCMGAHAGWISWLLVWGTTGEQLLSSGSGGPALGIGCWALISSAFCYLTDTWAASLEQS